MEVLRNKGIERAIKAGIYSIEIGGMSERELEQALDKRPFVLADYSRDMMQSLDFVTLAKAKEIRVTKVTLSDLGFTGDPTTAHILEQAQKLRLELLPAEVGPHARLQHRKQHAGDCYYIAMNPITCRLGNPNVFSVVRYGDDLWLGGRWANPGSQWDLHNSFVFGLPK